eukprot:Skav207165  [mRNA]  locus=scaffold573:463945:468342:- [translate_table: standard]
MIRWISEAVRVATKPWQGLLKASEERSGDAKRRHLLSSTRGPLVELPWTAQAVDDNVSQGLGRLKNGRTECVQGERREDKKGLGVEKRKSEECRVEAEQMLSLEQWDNWWADCFNSVAKSISVKAESRADSSDSDDEPQEHRGQSAEGGRITAIKKAGAMKGKLRRVLRQESHLVAASSAIASTVSAWLKRRKVRF